MSAAETPLLGLVPDELRALTAYTVPGGKAPVKLDANESPWPLPTEARERIGRALAEVEMHRYPDARASELRTALATHLECGEDELVIGCGSDEVIAILLAALSQPREGRTRPTVLYPTPTFVMYRVSALAHGVEPVEVPLGPRWALDLDAMRSALDRTRPNIVFLASPNNPTGNAFDDEAIEAIVRVAPGALVVIDEAYRAFAGRTLADWTKRFDNVAVLGTLSKIGLAAARVGWVRVAPALAREIDKARQPFNLSALSQRVATLALGELAHVLREHVREISRERTRLGTELARIPSLEVYPSAANFFLLRHDGDTPGLVARLAESGILVRSFHAQGGVLAHHLRITVGTPPENDRLLAALRR